MVNVVLVSHGSMAAGMREAAEMILGEQENLEVFGVYPGDTIETFSDKLDKLIGLFSDPANILILSDLAFGTPSNVTGMMVLKYHVRAVTGCNLPMLIEVLDRREDATVEELVGIAMEAGAKNIVDVSKKLFGGESAI